jgi:hypothetical protein
MHSSQDMAVTVLDKYDVYAGDKSEAGVGSRASRSTFMFIWISLLRIDFKPVQNSSARFGRILARKDGALNVRCTLRMRFCSSFISSFKTLFSMLGYIVLGFERIWVSMDVVRHPASYPMGTRDSFRAGKAAGV